MQSTRALRKISALKKKIRVLQGGQGAGKTIAVLILIINHLAGNPHKKALIASEELTKMRDTVVANAIDIIRAFNIPCSITGEKSGRPSIYFPNGSYIRFVGLDTEDIGKGMHGWDILYVNEANKVKAYETVRQLITRFKKVFIDFNPDAPFWVHEHVITRDDCDFITLTFEDNEYLDQDQVDEILRFYKLGYGIDYDPNRETDPPIVNSYWANKWRVYGRGEVGILEGAVYENWEIIDELPSEAKILGGGIDFGWVHPQAAVAVYEWNAMRIYDEVEYGSMRGTEKMGQSIIDADLSGEIWYCDNAAPELIDKLDDMGINATACIGKTGLINAAIDKQQRDKFYITKRSVNLIKEIRAYKWDGSKPIKIGDDGMNAIQYFEGSEGLYSGKYR